MNRARPSSLLPFEVVEVGSQINIFPRYSMDPARRAGVPLAGVKLYQLKTGARRGQSPRYTGWEPEARQDLEYLVHAANAYLGLVEALRELTTRLGDHEQWNPAMKPEQFRLALGTVQGSQQFTAAIALLRELGEAS